MKQEQKQEQTPEQIHTILKEIYYNPLTGFQNADKLHRKAKEQNAKITLDDANEFLKNQSVNQITKQVKPNKHFETILSPEIRNNYQIDIMYLPNPTLNKNFKYLLTCVDVFSRYAMVKPIKLKSGDEAFKAIKEIFEENGKPKNINVDMGKEFIYKPFVNWCKDNDIILWFSNPEQDNKNAIIERFHRTLRNLILKYSVANNKPYISDLQNLITNYNDTYHSTVKNKPHDIWIKKATNNQKVNLVIHNFEVGDTVRHLVTKKEFGKNSSSTSYTKGIFKIERLDKNSYYLEGIKKPFREHELVKAVGENIKSDYDDEIKEEKRQALIKRRLKKEGLD